MKVSGFCGGGIGGPGWGYMVVDVMMVATLKLSANKHSFLFMMVYLLTQNGNQ